MSQRDSLRQDTRSEGKVTGGRPDGEPLLRRIAYSDPASTGASLDDGAQQEAAQYFWNPLRGVVHLRTFAALRYREFLLLWSGQASTAMAMWMDQVVRGWLMYELTNSPVQLGLVHGVQAVPILVLSPISDSVADRYPRKQLLIVAQILAAVMYAGLALLIVTGHIQPWHLYATAFGMAIVQTFHQPARAAMVADAVRWRRWVRRAPCSQSRSVWRYRGPGSSARQVREVHGLPQQTFIEDRPCWFHDEGNLAERLAKRPFTGGGWCGWAASLAP